MATTRRYAESTAVPVAKSKAELEALIQRYGATEYTGGWNQHGSTIGAKMRGRILKFVVPAPRGEDHRYDARGRWRTEAQQRTAMEQAERTAWRRLLLLLHAKLEAIADEVADFDTEMAGNILLPDGSTVGDHLAEQVDAAYQTGVVPKQLPGLSKPPSSNIILLGEGQR